MTLRFIGHTNPDQIMRTSSLTKNARLTSADVNTTMNNKENMKDIPQLVTNSTWLSG